MCGCLNALDKSFLPLQSKIQHRDEITDEAIAGSDGVDGVDGRVSKMEYVAVLRPSDCSFTPQGHDEVGGKRTAPNGK